MNTLALERRLAAAERELAQLRQWVRSGPGSSSYGGATVNRPVQVGFPAKLTSTYSATTGYDWSMRVLTPGSAAVADVTNTVSGNGAVEVAGSTSLASGTYVWMEPDPNGRGFLFSAPSGAATTATSAYTYYNITANETWENTGWSITLPSAGTYLVFLCVGGEVVATALNSGGGSGFPTYIAVRLYNVTAAAAVAYTEAPVVSTGVVNRDFIGSTSVVGTVTATGATTIRVEGYRSPGTWDTAQLCPTVAGSTGNEASSLTYLKLS